MPDRSGPEALSVLGEAFCGQNSHKDVDGDKTHRYGVMGGLLHDLSPQSVGGVYSFGQLGLMVHKYSSDEFDEDSETGLGLGLGGGYGFSLGDTELWVERRYMRGNFDYGDTAYLGIVAGVSLALGGGD